MATRDDVLDVIGRIEKAGGASEATRVAQAALTLPLPPSGYDRLLTQLRLADPARSAEQLGPGVHAMKRAEDVLARQLSRTAEFDRRIIEALSNARISTVQGRKRLDELAGAVGEAAGSWDLSTAAGAREFQRFLITKMGEIIAIVDDANEDDSSKGALAAALLSLYAAESAHEAPPTDERDPRSVDEPRPGCPGEEQEPSLYFDDEPDTDAFGDESLEYPDQRALQPQSLVPPMPLLPGLGGDGPGLGAMPTGLPFTGLSSDTGMDADAFDPGQEGPGPDDPAGDDADEPHGSDDEESVLLGEDPLTVRLPDGEAVSISDPQLAAAMQAVADGKPVVEAFGSQGLYVAPPGSPVASPVEVTNLKPGDIGVFTDRHALAVGGGKALLDGQVHHVDNLRGPSFLGWQHPPVASTAATPNAEPAPTRPARVATIAKSLKNPI